jgi:ABC-2 type transport system ATP-binding protein
MDTTPQTAALQVSGLSYSYGANLVLSDVGFRVAEGRFKVLLGPNGAGKTTLFSLITRLFESPTGDIRVDGTELRSDSRRSLARMGVVFQAPTLDLDLSVRQNLLYHAALHGIKKSDAEGCVETELARLGMGERTDDKVRKLSGGHRRRVEMARALLHRPSLLLLDEPTVGLDVPTRRDIVEHVHRLARDDGIAVLWATHLIDEISDDDDVIVLHQGQVRADGVLGDVVRAAGAKNIAEAFDKLTGGSSG